MGFSIIIKCFIAEMFNFLILLTVENNIRRIQRLNTFSLSYKLTFLIVALGSVAMLAALFYVFKEKKKLKKD